MRWRVVLANIGVVLAWASLMYIPPAVVAFIDAGFTHEAASFLTAGALNLVLGGALTRLAREREPREAEAYILVASSWLVVTALAAWPIVLILDARWPAAFFEAMSGITTTGASALPAAETLPTSILFWRSFLQWVGGLGIVVIMVAILSEFTGAGVRLLQAEVSGGRIERLAPKIRHTAALMGRAYLGISAALFVVFTALFLRHVDSIGRAALEGIIHTFATISTGGFGTRGISVEAFQDPWIEAAIILGMVVGGTSFMLHVRALKGRPAAYWADPEFRFFVLMLAGATAVIWAVLALQMDRPPLDALRHAAFQVVSIATTTGFTSTNYGAWFEQAQFVVLFLMFTGGMVGSTAGSVKIARVLIFWNLLRAEMTRIGHPRAVVPIRIGAAVVESRAVQRASIFLFMYLTTVALVAFLVLLASDLDLVSALSAAAACVGNVGPGLDVVGPYGSYAAPAVPDLAQVVLSLGMWLGRLEIVGALVLFSRRALG